MKEVVVSWSLFLFIIAYIFIGAGILSVFERPIEIQNCELANEAISKIIKKSARLRVELPDDVRSDTKITEELVIMTQADFSLVFSQAYEIHLKNPNLLKTYDETEKVWSCPDNWNFGNSVWNAGTMIMSLGFSFTAPLTWSGKLFASFYVLFGVPLFFMSIFLVANQIVEKSIGTLLKLTAKAQVSSIIGYSFLVILLCSLAPAAILQAIEPLDLFDAWYFCITSITTVGFGDIRLTGVANAVWLIWLIFSLINFMVIAIVVYQRLTMSDFKKRAVIEDEVHLIRNQTDGMATYGNMQYHPTIASPYSTMAPPGYDENDYRTLSTIQVRPVDPQLHISETDETPKITIEDDSPPVSETSSIAAMEDNGETFAEVKPLMKK